MAGIGLTPCRSLDAENIRDLQRRAGHGPFRRWRVFLVRLEVLAWLLPGVLAQLRQLVERALDVRDHAGGDARVAGRRVQFVMTQERPDVPDIGAAFEQ